MVEMSCLQILTKGTVQTSAYNRVWSVHNIQAYFGKFSLIDMCQKILNLGELFRVQVKSQGQGHI